MIALKDDDDYSDHDNIIDGWWFCEVKENGDTLYDLHSTYCRLQATKKCSKKLHE